MQLLLAQILLLLTVILSTSAVPVPSNHVIKFVGMKNGYNSTSEASRELLENLRRITGHEDIVIDSLDESSASWHREGLSKSSGECPESEIRELFATIKAKDGGYTRTFKMELTENFSKPTAASIEWLGNCENVARKRSQVDEVSVTTEPDVSATDTEPDAATVTVTGSIPELIPNTAPDSTAPSPDISSTPTPTITTTTSDTITTSATEDAAAALVAALDSTTRAPEATTVATTAPPISSTTAATTTTPAVTTTMAATTTTTTATTTKTTTTTTTTPKEDTTTTTKTSPTTTVEPPDTTMPDMTDSAPSQPELTSTPQPLETTTSQKSMALLETEPPTSGSTSLVDSGPHYGKYIGLSTGFLLIVAYVVCSRAYKKQGIYELHNE